MQVWRWEQYTLQTDNRDLLNYFRAEKPRAANKTLVVPKSIPLPYEIHEKIISYLPLRSFLQARGVNCWYHATCMRLLHDRISLSSCLTLNISSTFPDEVGNVSCDRIIMAPLTALAPLRYRFISHIPALSAPYQRKIEISLRIEDVEVNVDFQSGIYFNGEAESRYTWIMTEDPFPASVVPHAKTKPLVYEGGEYYSWSHWNEEGRSLSRRVWIVFDAPHQRWLGPDAEECWRNHLNGKPTIEIRCLKGSKGVEISLPLHRLVSLFPGTCSSWSSQST